MEKAVYDLLAEWYPDGVFTEDELWEVIAEVDGHKLDYYADGDLTEWLQSTTHPLGWVRDNPIFCNVNYEAAKKSLELFLILSDAPAILYV